MHKTIDLSLAQKNNMFFGCGRSVTSNPSEMTSSMEDLESIVNYHLGNSFSSLDIDNVFIDDSGAASAAASANRTSRQKQFQMQRQGGNAASSIFSKSTVILEDLPSQLERPGSLGKIDRASTLGSFSINNGSFNASFRDLVSHVNSNATSNTSNSPKPDPLEKDGANSSSSEKDLKPVPIKKDPNSSPDIPENVSVNEDGSVPSSTTTTPAAGDDATTTTTAAAPPSSEQSKERTIIMVPHAHDILMGRGGKNNQWSGNETLRRFALDLSSSYRGASKRNKPAIAWILVTKMRSLNPPSRFLKQEPASGEWHEVDDDVAREKASQCLRDIVAARAKVSHVSGSSSPSDTLLGSVTEWDTSKASILQKLTRNSMAGVDGIAQEMRSSLLDVKRRICSAPSIGEMGKRQRTEPDLNGLNSQSTRNAVFAALRSQSPDSSTGTMDRLDPRMQMTLGLADSTGLAFQQHGTRRATLNDLSLTRQTENISSSIADELLIRQLHSLRGAHFHDDNVYPQDSIHPGGDMHLDNSNVRNLYKWNTGSNANDGNDAMCLASSLQQEFLLQQQIQQQQQQQQQSQLLAAELSDATINSKIANLSLYLQQIETAQKQRRNGSMSRSQRQLIQPDMPPPASNSNISNMHTDMFSTNASNNNRPRWL